MRVVHFNAKGVGVTDRTDEKNAKTTQWQWHIVCNNNNTTINHMRNTINMFIKCGSVVLMKKELVLQTEQMKKKCLPNKLLGKSTKTAMLTTTTKSLCTLKKNTTTNLNVAHVDQIVLNDGVNNEMWYEVFVRKKHLITCIVNNANLLRMTSFGNGV